MTTIETSELLTPQGYSAFGGIEFTRDAALISEIVNNNPSCIVKGVEDMSTASRLGQAVGYMCRLVYGANAAVVSLEENDGDNGKTFAELSRILDNRDVDLLVLSGFERLFSKSDTAADHKHAAIADRVDSLRHPSPPKLCAIPADSSFQGSFSTEYTFRGLMQPEDATRLLARSNGIEVFQARHIISTIPAAELTYSAVDDLSASLNAA